jgi:hypothetical protein
MLFAREPREPRVSLSSLEPIRIHPSEPVGSKTTVRQPLGLTPDLVGDLPDESQLLLLVFQRQGIARLVGTKTALRTESDTLQSLLLCLTTSFGDELGCLVDSLLDLLLILQFP